MYKCPKCGKSEFLVDAIVDGAVNAEGELEILGGNARFEPNSWMMCICCGVTGSAHKFVDADGPVPTVKPEEDTDHPDQRRLGMNHEEYAHFLKRMGMDCKENS